MGLYMYVSIEDRISKRKVSDKLMNAIFQDALKLDPSLMIEEYPSTKRVRVHILKYEIVDNTRYCIYHESPALDGYTGFDYVIDNNGTIDELIEKVKQIFEQEKQKQ